MHDIKVSSVANISLQCWSSSGHGNTVQKHSFKYENTESLTLHYCIVALIIHMGKSDCFDSCSTAIRKTFL